MTKTQANQANAQKSTGPKSAAGKARSSRNAISHGFQSSDIVLAHESAAEFDGILHHYQQQVDLADPEQAFLAGEIANAQWRVRRAQRLTRLYLDLEISGSSTDPSPDEIIVRNMEQRGNDVPATLHRHETHFQRLWWRIHRKIEALRERNTGAWDYDLDQQLIREEQIEFAHLKASSERRRAEAERQAIQEPQHEQHEPEDNPLTPEQAVELMTIERCHAIVETAARLENAQTNPPSEQAVEERFLLSLESEMREAVWGAAKARITRTKPAAKAA